MNGDLEREFWTEVIAGAATGVLTSIFFAFMERKSRQEVAGRFLFRDREGNRLAARALSGREGFVVELKSNGQVVGHASITRRRGA